MPPPQPQPPRPTPLFVPPLSLGTSSPTATSTASSSAASTSPSSSASSHISDYLWTTLLIGLSKAAARSTAPSLVLPVDAEELHEASTCQAADVNLNYRPVIGILSHPGDGASGRLNEASNASYIAASYVKFVESAGARVIPLIYNEPKDILYEKLNLVNGVLFTGGWAKDGLYFEVAELIFKIVLRKNDAGDHFPLHAICLGFELLTMIVSKDNRVLEEFNAASHASTLQFVKSIDINETVFQRFPPVLLKKLSTECLIMQHHCYGISPERFQNNKKLCNFFEILTTSADKDNKVCVSTVKARRYPVTAFQWHPEKNAFEWGIPTIPHSEDAVQVTQQVANFFVREARKSLNRPSARKILDNLIYNYSPTYCGKAGRGFDEVYIFT
ncbi:gamma-glutamyl hydrolase 2-like isoform X1 [Primulina tabacum]|uniref:gamma-glutamyl hydrolase 2-like isoform X1 n=2 Tax=Primulina tabacum TaxID=48773 RepID=UPI003F5A9390